MAAASLTFTRPSPPSPCSTANVCTSTCLGWLSGSLPLLFSIVSPCFRRTCSIFRQAPGSCIYKNSIVSTLARVLILSWEGQYCQHAGACTNTFIYASGCTNTQGPFKKALSRARCKVWPWTHQSFSLCIFERIRWRSFRHWPSLKNV